MSEKARSTVVDTVLHAAVARWLDRDTKDTKEGRRPTAIHGRREVAFKTTMTELQLRDTTRCVNPAMLGDDQHKDKDKNNNSNEVHVIDIVAVRVRYTVRGQGVFRNLLAFMKEYMNRRPGYWTAIYVEAVLSKRFLTFLQGLGGAYCGRGDTNCVYLRLDVPYGNALWTLHSPSPHPRRAADAPNDMLLEFEQAEDWIASTV